MKEVEILPLLLSLLGHPTNPSHWFNNTYFSYRAQTGVIRRLFTVQSGSNSSNRGVCSRKGFGWCRLFDLESPGVRLLCDHPRGEDNYFVSPAQLGIRSKIPFPLCKFFVW